MTKMDISRRTFIHTAAAAGGGMILGFSIPGISPALARSVMPEGWKDPAGGVEISAWLTIDTDGTVTVRVPHTEMGQGALTSVAMFIAEELDVPWKDVKAVFASANRHITQGEEYVNMSTYGSNLVRNRHPHILQAGASARERLKEAAALQWGVARSAVTAKQGVLSAGANKGTYGEFASAAAAVSLAEEPKAKEYLDWWLLGTDVPRMDVDIKTDGSAIYPIDVVVPGMVYASVMSCPVPNGRLKSYDFDVIKNRPGVIQAVALTQVKDKLGTSDQMSGIAVVADTFYRAKTALELMPVEWDLGEGVSLSTESMEAEAQGLLGMDAEHVEEVRGDPRPVLAASDKIVTADYQRPTESHVTMEPAAAVVSITKDRVDVWSKTQTVQGTLMLVADQLGRPPGDIFVHGTSQGGGFGFGSAHPAPRQAAEIAQAVGRPVKVIWTREEDLAQARTRPPVWGRFTAALGSDGLPTAMLARTVGSSRKPDFADRAIVDQHYQVPNYRFERHAIKSHLPVGYNRAPGTNSNGFLIEQFADEMALAGGWDPLDWRIKMTEGNERWQRVLAKMKEVCGYSNDLPKGRGMGVAVVEAHNATVGACATVEVTKRGNLYIEKIHIVSNTGYVINPRNAHEQNFSSVVWELSHALTGGLDIKGGSITNGNLDKYALMRMPEAPVVESSWAMSHDGWWGGFGETAAPPTPPAVANAIFAATGKRVRSTPMIKHDLSWS